MVGVTPSFPVSILHPPEGSVVTGSGTALHVDVSLDAEVSSGPFPLCAPSLPEGRSAAKGRTMVLVGVAPSVLIGAPYPPEGCPVACCQN